MKVTFGLYLDGQRSCHRSNVLGHSTVGPMGLLSLLETFLGLPKPRESEGERIIQYRELLSKLDAPDRFYHRSFDADQYAVARTLLGWRDTWYLHGWDGKFNQPVPKRLSDIAEIEKHAKGELAPCIGERLVVIAEALQHRQHPIESVELADPIADFPMRWRSVLQLLSLTQSQTLSFFSGSDYTNLSQLQQKLLHQDGNQVSWQQDDSVIVLRSHSRISAACAISQLLSRDASETLFVAETEGALYDTLSSAQGNARLGISEKSKLRPSLQLLSLAFSLLWKPLDVYALLEFLAHPMSPLPRYAGALLAEAVAAQPGIGGEKWQQALTKIKETAGNKSDAILETVNQWLQPPSIAAGDPAPVALLEEVALRVAKAFRSRLGDEDYYAQRAQHSGSMQCSQIAASLRLLRKQGIQSITHLQLDQMLEQTGGAGEGNSAVLPEVGSPLLVTQAAAAHQPIDTLIWWNMAAPSLPASYPWHTHELVTLREAGVLLPDTTAIMEREARNWLRPILAARRQLILVLPPEGEEVHPVWLSIEQTYLKGSIRIRSVEDVLENRLAVCAAEPVNHQPLPRLRRWWQLNQNSIPIRKNHSFSSLDKFINNPFEWVMRYPAQISPPSILSVSGGPMLLGSIAHRSVELLHANPEALRWTPEEAAAWVDLRLKTLLEEEGAVLLLPGHRATVEGFRQNLLAAVRELHKQLQSASVQRVEPEKELDGSFFMGTLGGYIDILATRQDGAAAVVDMKWSRGKVYHQKLKENRQLQLAIYGELMRQKTRHWAVPAYFILAEGRLYAQDNLYFPDATVTRTKEDGGSAELWQKALETLRWRHEQILKGTVEVVVAGTEADQDSSWPEGALEVEGPSPWASDYAWLAGWRNDA